MYRVYLENNEFKEYPTIAILCGYLDTLLDYEPLFHSTLDANLSIDKCSLFYTSGNSVLFILDVNYLTCCRKYLGKKLNTGIFESYERPRFIEIYKQLRSEIVYNILHVN